MNPDLNQLTGLIAKQTEGFQELPPGFTPEGTAGEICEAISAAMQTVQQGLGLG